MCDDDKITGNEVAIEELMQEFLILNKNETDKLLYKYKTRHSTFTSKSSLVTAKSKDFLNTNIDVLILTATPIETFTVLSEMIQQNPPVQELTADNGCLYHVGILGEYNVVHVESQMGSDAYDTAQMAINKWNPKLVVSLGIAYGSIPDKQKLGDVIFPTLILPPIDGKISNGELYFNKNTWAPNTDTYFRNLVSFITNYYSQDTRFALHIGSIISCPFVISDPNFKKMLFDSVKHFRAIGGEMESYGIFKAVYESEKTLGKKYCFMLKGISDWGESKNCSSDDDNDRVQLFAARNALSVLLKLMSEGEYFKPIGILSHEYRAEIDLIKLRLKQYPNLGKFVLGTKQTFKDILKLHLELYNEDEIREFLDNLKAYGYCDRDNNLTDNGVLLLYSLWK